jgi:hypothetical protein
MAQGTGRPRHQLGHGPSPSAIRSAIAETRQVLAQHLGALRERLLPPLQSESADSNPETTMATQKKTGRSSAVSRGRSSKAQAAGKSSSQAGSPAPAKRARAELKKAAPKASSSKKN